MRKYFKKISKFLSSLMLINLFVTDPSKGASRLEDEIDEMKPTYSSSTGQKKLDNIDVKKESSKLDLVSLHHDKDNSPIGILLADTLIHVFGFLKIEDLGRVSRVSNHWREVSCQLQLWRRVGHQYCGDYLTPDEFKETPRQKVIHHYLSVYVNTIDDLKRINKIICYYNLDQYIPVSRCIFLSILLDHGFPIANDMHSDDLLKLCNFGYGDSILKVRNDWSHERSIRTYPQVARAINDFLIERGNQEAIERKVKGLELGCWGYEKDTIAARELNDLLVEKGDRTAIGRKISGLTHGMHGYEINPIAARKIKDLLVERGDKWAIKCKVEGFSYGYYGYEKDTIAARELNDLLVERGDQDAIERKIDGLAYGTCGYEKNPIAARELNDLLVERGDQMAIKEKIGGLTFGCFGYEKNFTALREFNELLIEREDQDAIERKIRGLNFGQDGYEINPIALREFNDLLVERGDQKAIERKVEGLKEGKFGYRRNLVALCSFLINRGDRTLVREVIEKLISGNRSTYETGPFSAIHVTYGQNPKAARELNDLLVESGDQTAIEIKIRGLENGSSGYEKNPVAAKELNDFFAERGDQEAIERKFRGFTEGLFGYERNLNIAIEFAYFYADSGNIDIVARIAKLVLCSVSIESNKKSMLIEDKLIQRAHPIIQGIGRYFKMLGLKYGMFGYEKNSVEAIKYIKLYNIPY